MAYLLASGRFGDWLPNHLLVIHILFVFAVLNPLVTPFGLLYFTIQKSTISALRRRMCCLYFSPIAVIKNQFLHVYAKDYEENGQRILIRIIRYSLDGMGFHHMKMRRSSDGGIIRSGACTSTLLGLRKLDGR
jgi:hypothetical protein